MKPPYPSPTPTWHNDKYPAISAESLGTTHAGKTVVIFGAGSGIGRATALAFADVKAGRLVLAGRTQSTLSETQKLLPSSVKSSVHVCDVVQSQDVEDLAEKVGQWDIIILSSGMTQAPASIAQMPVKDIWSSYEANVKSLLNVSHYFIKTAAPEASLIALTSGSLVLPVQYTLLQADYQVSKLAQVKTIEYLAAQNPNISFFALHPGLIETKVFLASGADSKGLPMDTPELPAYFSAWLASPKGKFLNGRMMFANWDVTELENIKEDIASSLTMTIGLNGWPFAHVG